MMGEDEEERHFHGVRGDVEWRAGGRGGPGFTARHQPLLIRKVIQTLS